MKKLLLLLLACSSVSVGAQTLVSYTLIVSYTTDQIDSIFAANGIPGIILPTTYDVDVYEVHYNTLDADSVPILASGAVFIPKDPECLVPLTSYQHGSISLKSAAPSTLNATEVIIGEFMASDGSVVCMPDYLGLGVSPGLHPYVHAATEARATADLLVVTLQICDELGIQRNGQLFLVGYSQGGHATMAAHQMIQESYSSYFTVTASAPMSGPYDLSGIQADVIASDIEYPSPSYLPYFLLAYNEVYHLYDDLSDLLVAPYDTMLPPLFDGTHDLWEVDDVMPSIPNQIIVPAVLDSFKNDTTYRLHEYLRENDTYNWKPENMLRMFYCEADQDVSYLNALVAYDHLVANGSTVISKQSSGAGNDHSACVLPALLGAKFLFDSLRLDKLKMAFDVTGTTSATASDGSLVVHVSGGYPPFTYSWNNGITDSANTGLPVGFYTVTVSDATGCSASASIFLSVQVGMEHPLAGLTLVYPNPMHTMTSVELPVFNTYVLEITDAAGRLVMQDQFTGYKYVLLRQNIPAGSYLMKITDTRGSGFCKLLLVQ